MQMLTIKIENVNDISPEFVDLPSGLTLDIFENDDNIELYEIRAEDAEFPDKVSELSLELLQPEQNKPFTITKDSEEDGVWTLGVAGKQ